MFLLLSKEIVWLEIYSKVNKSSDLIAGIGVATEDRADRIDLEAESLDKSWYSGV